MRPKQSYHSSLILLHQSGLLPQKVKANIPRTTLHSWQHRNLALLVGNEQARLVEENTQLLMLLGKYEKLLSAAKVLVLVFKLYQKVLFSFKNGRKRLLENKTVIKGIAEYSANKISRLMLCRMLHTTPAYLKNLLLPKPCVHSPLLLCKGIFPRQLTFKETFTIKAYLSAKEFLHWPLSSVYFKMMKDKAAYCSLSAFYKYARKLGIKRSRQPRLKDRNKKGLRASEPMQILHMDFTMLRLLDHTKAYLHFITDNFSRKILAYAVSLKPSAEVAAQNLRRLVAELDFQAPPALVITDDGAENKGQTAELFAQKPELLKHLIAQRDIIFSNSMAEAANKSMKYYHLFNREFSCFEALEKQLPDCVEEYNNRPVLALNGRTPDEAFETKIRTKGLFAEQIQTAGSQRITENQSKNCGVC